MADDVPGRHLLQVELQAARQHGDRDLLRVGGREDELDVLRRLFQRLQHRVEGVVGQHVHLVDHVDLVARVRRRVHGLLEQLRHFVDAAVRRRVHLDIVDEAAGVDRDAGFAHAARLGGDAAVAVRADAVERLGQDARQRGLADAAGPGEQVGVVQAAGLQRVRQARAPRAPGRRAFRSSWDGICGRGLDRTCWDFTVCGAVTSGQSGPRAK